MALFGSKKGKKAASEKVDTSKLGPVNRDVSQIILRPIVSEKTALMGERNIYTFEVARSANKFDVRDAVRKLWNVVPQKVSIVNHKPQTFMVRSKNRLGSRAGVKKAYVYLKKGDTINLV